MNSGDVALTIILVVVLGVVVLCVIAALLDFFPYDHR